MDELWGDYIQRKNREEQERRERQEERERQERDKNPPQYSFRGHQPSIKIRERIERKKREEEWVERAKQLEQRIEALEKLVDQMRHPPMTSVNCYAEPSKKKDDEPEYSDSDDPYGFGIDF